MRLTDEQRRAVRSPGSALVVACPGSGKTRTILAKLVHCLDDVRGTSRRVACITYTNAAVNEIESRLRSLSGGDDETYYDISTIHSFCVTNVLRHYYWRLPEYRSGFSILPADSEEYHEELSGVFERHGIPRKAMEQFDLISRGEDGEPLISDTRITRDAVLEFWSNLARHGLVDFPNIVYQSFRLLREYPRIAQGLACRFRWILVDEFQDTTGLQVEILRSIAAWEKTQFFLVGDPHQSIFGFAGARPQLMREFALEIGAATDLPLHGNFRCSQGIVNHAERLLPRTPEMVATGENAGIDDLPEYVHESACFTAITDVFLPALEEQGIPYGGAAVLAPSWFKLIPIGRSLREYGVPVVGPGARPYKRSRLFAVLAEQAGAYAVSGDPRYVRPTERALFELVQSATGQVPNDVHTYRGRRATCRILRIAEELSIGTDSGIEWLNEAATAFGEVMVDAEWIDRSMQDLLSESVSEMEDDMRRNGTDVENLTIADLGIYADPQSNMKLLTLHSAKGREFEAVAIVGLHDGSVPDFRATTEAEIEEGRRVFYVGITRAKRLLLYITDQEHPRNRPSPFLREMGVVS